MIKVLILVLICSVGLATTQVSKRKSSKFFKELAEFRAELVEDLQPFVFPLVAEMVSPTWQPSNRITWNSLTCKQAGVEFRLGRKVFGDGDGGNKVYRATDRNTGQVYAYKQFGNSHDLVGEISFYMQSGSHPNLLKPICVNRPGNGRERAHGGLLMEWFEGEDSLAWASSQHVSEYDIIKMNKAVMETIVYIHSLGFVHADLKPENILVNKGVAKIIDFGFTTAVNSVQAHRGNPRIVAPELAGIGTGRIGFGADWWAFGVVVASLHSQKYRSLHSRRGRPYSPVRIDKDGEDWQFGPAPSEFSPATLHLLHTLFHHDPDMRSFSLSSNLALLRSHPYFNA